MGASGRRTALPGIASLGVLVFLLLCGAQQAAAQNYTRLRGGVTLPPVVQIDNVTEAKELQGLLQKLPQITGTRAEQQVRLLSANSRSKLNNLTGSADVWLRNRTDTQLERLFEDIRSENFVRTMALGSIFTQLPKCFSSCNVLASLERLQTEDLVRLASLPLFDERYQRLTNNTFLDLLQQLYSFGLTQVPQRTCVLTGANTSDISQLPTADPVAAAAAAGTLKMIYADAANSNPVVSYVAPSLDRPIPTGSLSLSNTGRRKRSRNLLGVLSDAAHSVLQMDHAEMAAAVVQAVTRGPGSAPSHLRRKLMQQTVTDPNSRPDASLAPIVTKFLDQLPATTTGPNGAPLAPTAPVTTVNSNPGGLLTTALGVPGLSTQPGFIDSRVISGACTESMGAFPQIIVTSQASGPSAGGSGSSGGGSSSSGGSSGGSNAASISNAVPEANSLQLPVNCSNGIWNGTACVPCPPGAVVGGNASLCECPVGTAWDATSQSCTAAGPCINGTTANGTACSGVGPSLSLPCVNGTLPDGATPCNSTNSTPPLPCVNGTLPNGTACTPVASPRSPLRGNRTRAASFNVTTTTDNMPVLNATMPSGRRRRSANATMPIVPAGVVANQLPRDPQALNDTQALNGSVLGPPAPLPPGGSNDTTPSSNTSQPLGPRTRGSQQTPDPPAVGNNGSQVAQPPGSDGLQQPGPAQALNTTAQQQPPAQEVPPAAQQPAAPRSRRSKRSSVSSPAPEGIVSQGPTQGPDPLGGLLANMRNNPTPQNPQGTPPPPPAPAAPSPAVQVQPTPTPVVPSPPATPPTPVPMPAPVAATSPAPVVPTTLQPVVQPAAVVEPAVQPAVVQPVVQPAAVVPPTPAVQPVPAAPVVVRAADAPPVNCVGQWVDSGACSATCADVPGTRTQLYQVTTPAANGGAPCEAAAGATRQVSCTNPTPCPKPPVNCVGQWVDSGACTATCADVPGTRTQLYQVTTAAANGGAPCEAAAGATKQVPCTNPTPCPKPPVNCVGSWSEMGTCSAPCEGTGTKTSVYTVTVPAANGGAPCEAASGATKQVPCTNPTPCPKPPVNCVGSWAETGTCSAPCEGTGTKTSVYTVTVPAANGGAPCEAASGATKQVPCSNTTPCPKAATPVVTAPAVTAPTVVAPVATTPAATTPVATAPVVTGRTGPRHQG